MSEFNKDYVYFMRDEELCGKYGYFADNIDNLSTIVNDNDMLSFWGKLSCDASTDNSFPFVKEENNKHYRFFYHDPALMKHPVRYVTNRELALWLAHGNGEACYFSGDEPCSVCFTEFRYNLDEGDKPVVARPMVRKWSDLEWNELTPSYLGLGN